VSFILDALQKSENERQRQAGPGFATVPESSGGRPRKIWPFVVAVLLAVNLVVIGAVLMRDRPGTPDAAPAIGPARTVPAARPAPQPPASPSGTQSSTSPRSAPAGTSSTTRSAPESAQQATAAGQEPATGPGPDRQVRPLAEEVRGGRSTGAVAGDGSAKDTATAESATATVAATRQASPPAQQAPSSSVDSLPTSNDLRLEGFLTGPPLHLDLHVYYPDHQRRVVFISGSKYREGDTTKAGTLVREIVPEGVILEERGRRYLLTPD